MEFNVKKFASVLLAVVMLFSMCAMISATAAETSGAVGAGLTVTGTSNFFAQTSKTLAMSTGDTFVTVEYQLKASDMYLIDVDIDELTYDPAVLEWKEEYNQYEAGQNSILDFFPFAAEFNLGTGTVKQTAPGRVIGNFSSVNPAAYAHGETPNDPVTVVKATFKVLNKNAGSTDVTCTVDTLGFCETSLPNPKLQYLAIDGKVVNPTNKAKATYNTIITVNGSEAPVLMGDVDSNGVVNINDATTLQRYLAEFNPTINLAVADVNFDGVINVCDVTEIQRFCADIIHEFVK